MGWPRAKFRRASSFGRGHTVHSATQFVLKELHRLGAEAVIVSTNVELRLDGLPRSNAPTPSDRGVAVYFRLKKVDSVLACDLWDRVEHNLHAIGKHIEAIRGQARWGVGTTDQAFAGYKALPQNASAETNGHRPWWVVMGFEDDAQTFEVIRDCYRMLAKERHPDVNGGDSSAFVELRQAYEEACFDIGAEY